MNFSFGILHYVVLHYSETAPSLLGSKAVTLPGNRGFWWGGGGSGPTPVIGLVDSRGDDVPIRFFFTSGTLLSWKRVQIM